MDQEEPLVDQHYFLQKFPGKGGWTYAAIPEIIQNPQNPFGWVQVRGSIDGFPIKQYKLMPMGNGRLFLPVKAEIRKKIGKQSGDSVHIILYADHTVFEAPEEILDCLKLESDAALQNFLDMSSGEQKAYVDWIYQARTEETRAARIVTMMDRVARNLKYYDNSDET